VNDIFDDHVDWITALGSNNFKFPLSRRRHFESSFCATSNSDLSIEFSEDKRRITLKGILIDIIEQVGVVCDREEGFKLGNHLNILKNWQDVCALDTATEYINGGDSQLAYWRTVSMAHELLAVEEAKPQFEQYYLEVLLKTEWAQRNEDVTRISEVENTKVRQLATLMEQWRKGPNIDPLKASLSSMANRRMARSLRGYFAMVLACVRFGDCIAVFAGGDMPLVVRPRSGSWKLLGESYVHGIMHGEAFREADCKRIELI
jgi:hypothetical protein